MPEAFVELRNVQKTIKGQTIVRDVNLNIAQGQIVALCGGNGAGKSTVLRMIAGIIHPTRGEITVGGVRWKDDRMRYAEQIGYMPDDYRFAGGLTARETMAFWTKMRGVPKQRAEEALAEVGLADTGTKPVSSFSKGMRQRILFAQALLARPPLIVMDEPTNGLDPHWTETFVKLVRQAGKRGQTVIFSTHQLEVARALADRVVLLQDGIVVEKHGGVIG